MAVVYYNRGGFERQCVMRNAQCSMNSGEQMKILYVSRAENETSIVPTSFHAHEGIFELQYCFET